METAGLEFEFADTLDDNVVMLLDVAQFIDGILEGKTLYVLLPKPVGIICCCFMHIYLTYLYPYRTSQERGISSVPLLEDVISMLVEDVLDFDSLNSEGSETVCCHRSLREARAYHPSQFSCNPKIYVSPQWPKHLASNSSG